MKRLSLPALLLLAGCAASPAITPDQHLFLATSAYVSAVEQAAAYREQCDAKPEVLQGTCRRVVSELQAVDREAEPLLEQAILALESGNADSMTTAANAITAVKTRLEQRLAQALLEQQKSTLEPNP